MGIEIRLTGLPTMRGHDGVDRYLTRKQARVAFVRLVLDRPTGTTRDELADTLWPGRLPDTWESALRTVVSRVRSFVATGLGQDTDPIVSESGRYRLELPDDAVVDLESAAAAITEAQSALADNRYADAHRQAMHGAAQLRTPLLPERDDSWLTVMRERLAEVLVTGLEVASSAAIELGDPTSALQLANEAISRAPLRESAHRLRMVAYQVAGNRAEALRAYQRLRRLLLEDLGIDPSPETEAIYCDLLGPIPATADRPTRPAPGPRLSTPPPFVGRSEPLALVHDAWAAATAARRQVILLSGETGIGKTRLALEAGRQVTRNGGLLLFGRCDRQPVVPYQPIVEVLDAYIAAVPEDELPDLRPASCAALAAVLPSFPCPHRHVESWDMFRLFDAMTRLVAWATADRPMFVVLDDMQWADEDTLLLVRHLLRRTRGTRLLVVVITRRALQSPHPLTDLDRALDCDGRSTRLALTGLEEADVAELIDQMVPPSEPSYGMAARLLAATGGNPLVLMELFNGDWDWARGFSQVPRSIEDLLHHRLDDLSPRARELLEDVAVETASSAP